MIECFTTNTNDAIAVLMFTKDQYDHIRETLSEFARQWLESCGFECQIGSFCLVPNDCGAIGTVLVCIANNHDLATTAKIARQLPKGHYHLQFQSTLNTNQLFNHALYWGLGCYEFIRYQSHPSATNTSILVLDQAMNAKLLSDILESMYLGQDLINTPTEDLNPQHLTEACQSIAEQFDAHIEVIQGDQLLERGFPLIHAVGRASHHPPCLIDLTWGNPSAPTITLVGKGVCYDTGGLSLKPTSNMKAMKKDMGGAASALVLARLIMSQQLDVSLRLLIPAVENSVAGSSYRPGDVFISRKGVSVEITNTDAEGRLILADALTYAQESQAPDLLFDFATLTGAARVAMGPDVSPVFANCDQDAVALANMAQQYGEDLWPMPVYKPYKSALKSDIAHMTNSANTGFGGAITAALFLQEFVEPSQRWWHFDVYCSISQNWTGLGKGARIPVLYTVFEFIKDHVMRVMNQKEMKV